MTQESQSHGRDDVLACPEDRSPFWCSPYFKVLALLALLYIFFLSIGLIGNAAKLFGKGFAEQLIVTTSNPMVGLLIGILATSVIQSSSTTTSLVVGFVGANALNLTNAIPIVMGANIGTTVTNILVSFAHATRHIEFKRAFAAAVVHDFFNILSVIILFPIELKFRIIEKSAIFLEKIFENAGGLVLFNPLKYIIDPAIHLFDKIMGGLPHAGIFMAIAALVFLFVALSQMVVIIRSLVMGRFEIILDRYLFRNAVYAFLLATCLTAIVQSSSVTTSIIIPLAAAGILSLRQVFPYTLGANMGTTITAIIAALAIGNPACVTVAFCHSLFNGFGICFFYPLRIIPITLASKIGDFIGKSRKNAWIVIGCFMLIYVIPILLIILK